jgi:hypothetical protein
MVRSLHVDIDCLEDLQQTAEVAGDVVLTRLLELAKTRVIGQIPR